MAVLGSGLPAQQSDLEQVYREAQQAQNAGNITLAAQKYEEIIKLQPNMAEAYANLGNLYFQLNKYDQAAASYKHALRLKPALAGPNFFLGVMAFNARSYQEALRYLKEAAAGEPQNEFVHAYLGYTFYALGDFDSAAGRLEKAAALQPGDTDLVYSLGKSYGHLAESSILELKRRYRDSFYTYLARAHVFEADQDWKRAAEDYKAALEKEPGNTRLAKKVAWVAARADGKPAGNDSPSDEIIDGSLRYLYAPPSGNALKQEFAARQKALHELRKQAPTPEQYYRAGETYQILAYLSSLIVIEMDPKSARSHQLQAQLYESAGKEDEAIAEYREILRLEPNAPNIHFLIGSLLWKNQHLVEAKVELLKELQRDPHHPNALYEIADIESTAGNNKEAEQYYLKALQYEPRMVEAHFALEKIYTAAGQYDKSLEHLRTAMKIDDSDPTPHYRLAQIYRRLGKMDEAQAELKIFESRREQNKK